MRLSSPDDDKIELDNDSPSSGRAIVGTSPVWSSSRSFPSVHRALYALQGHRLDQNADVDIANLLQFPQYYWNNWDQWMSNSMDDIGETNHSHLTSSSLAPTDPSWSLPSLAAGNEHLGQSQELPSNAEAQGQAAVSTALLQYMLQGAHGGY